MYVYIYVHILGSPHPPTPNNPRILQGLSAPKGNLEKSYSWIFRSEDNECVRSVGPLSGSAGVDVDRRRIPTMSFVRMEHVPHTHTHRSTRARVKGSVEKSLRQRKSCQPPPASRSENTAMPNADTPHHRRREEQLHPTPTPRYLPYHTVPYSFV